jgi:hypothetical protein
MTAVEQLVQELKKLGVLKIDDLHWTEQDDVNNAIKQAQAMVVKRGAKEIRNPVNTKRLNARTMDNPLTRRTNGRHFVPRAHQKRHSAIRSRSV